MRSNDTRMPSGWGMHAPDRPVPEPRAVTGMPALATALIPLNSRNEYNDDDVLDDLSKGANGEFKWVPALRNSLLALTTALADDFQRAGLREGLHHGGADAPTPTAHRTSAAVLLSPSSCLIRPRWNSTDFVLMPSSGSPCTGAASPVRCRR